MEEVLRTQRIEEAAPSPNGYDLIFRSIELFVTDTVKQAEELRKLGWKRFLPFAKHRIQRPEKRILHELTGIFRASRSTAILGPSGAGKTSLLSIIVSRTSTGNLILIILTGRRSTKECKVDWQLECRFSRAESSRNQKVFWFCLSRRRHSGHHDRERSNWNVSSFASSQGN